MTVTIFVIAILPKKKRDGIFILKNNWLRYVFAHSTFKYIRTFYSVNGFLYMFYYNWSNSDRKRLMIPRNKENRTMM